jgi:hypothetical protein
LREYINAALTDSKYVELRRSIARKPEDPSQPQVVEVEIQDSYLASPTLPSRRGKLVREDWRRYPYLAVALGLLRPSTYSLTGMGQAFLALVPDGERASFNAATPAYSAQSNANPLLLTAQQKLLLLFCFLQSDGSILQSLYARLLQIPSPIADWEAGALLADIYRQASKRLSPRSGEDLTKIQKLLDTAIKIDSWQGRPYKGRGARDEAATIRLEPFVDLGLLTKPDPLAYRYKTTNETREFFALLELSESIDKFLNNSFFSAYANALAQRNKHRSDRVSVLSAVQRAFNVLKSPLGYAPILEVSLLAGINTLADSGTYFEIAECLDWLKLLQKERPELVRFNVNRRGDLTFIKFTDDIVEGVRR